MSLLLKLFGIAFVAVSAFSLLKTSQPQIGNLLLISAGALILILLSDQIAYVVSTFSTLGEKSGLSGTVFSTLLKIVGIGYLTEYAVSLCEDSGCSSLGKKIELGGKTIILVSSMPIITQIITIIEELF